MKHAYQKFLEDELILRDKLAIDRTVLANERTVLAYIRTSLTLIIAGITVIKLVPEQLFIGLGWLAILVGVGILVIGVARYKQMKQAVSVLTSPKE